jgi:hypothetical protein
MKKLGKPTYEWAPSPVALFLTFLVWLITYTWEIHLIYPYIDELPNWLDKFLSVTFVFYFFFVKPFLIFKCIGLLLYVYVKLTTKYE